MNLYYCEKSDCHVVIALVSPPQQGDTCPACKRHTHFLPVEPLAQEEPAAEREEKEKES